MTSDPTGQKLVKPAQAQTLRVTVAAAQGPRQVTEIHLLLPKGSTVADALRASGLLLLPTEPDAGVNQVAMGIWGRKANPSQQVHDLDRVEIYRPLKVDPKVARRARFAKQGAKTAGLFAKLREGAKSGY